MSGPLLGRTVLVTGAAGGIGRASAIAAAARGARLIVTDIKADELAATVEIIAGSGADVLTSEVVDLTDHDAVTSFGERVHTDHGSVDVIMNVAGTSTWGPVDRLTHDDWRGMVEVDLMGPINVIETFVPQMISAGRGGHLVKRLIRGGSARPSLARRLQRCQVRDQRRLGSIALRPRAARHRRHAGLPRSRRHTARRDGEDRGHRSRPSPRPRMAALPPPSEERAGRRRDDHRGGRERPLPRDHLTRDQARLLAEMVVPAALSKGDAAAEPRADERRRAGCPRPVRTMPGSASGRSERAGSSGSGCFATGTRLLEAIGL